MIPRLNMSEIGGLVDKSTSEDLKFPRRGDQTGNGGIVDLVRFQQEGRTSTPLRNRGSVKSISRSNRDLSPGKCGIRGVCDESSTSADLRRRAEDVSSLLGVNILHVQDVSLLQRKAIEIAERLLSVEEWYSGRLQERGTYLEHRIAQLVAANAAAAAAAAAAVPVGSNPAVPTSPVPSDGDKWASPSAIRSRQFSATVGMSRPALNVNASRDGHNAMQPPPPMPEPPGPSSPAVSSRLGVLPKRIGRESTGGGRRGQRKPRSSSLGVNRAGRGTGGDGSDATEEDLLQGRDNSNTVVRSKRRSVGGNSAGFLSLSMRQTTPKRPRPSSGRLGHTPDGFKRD